MSEATFQALALALGALAVGLLVACLVRITALKSQTERFKGELIDLNKQFNDLEGKVERTFSNADHWFGKTYDVIESGQACRVGGDMFKVLKAVETLGRRVNRLASASDAGVPLPEGGGPGEGEEDE